MKIRIAGFIGAVGLLLGGMYWAYWRVKKAQEEGWTIRLRDQTLPIVMMFVGITIAYAMAGHSAFIRR